ncbi:TonB-dependent receptor [Thalassotalea nanhaiensis]|uniref:TonB-dependent receptor n=1 Tax=Thalassotalea nanhaiensis TaxID=3065648 RepID=A0ABY9TJW5_9GAMM|nr:TonB-dependent receptor [Colwelliaceae bacterium SQ345]
MKKSKISLALLAALQLPAYAIAQEETSETQAVTSVQAEEELEVIEVTGIRSSLTEALGNKRNAANIIDSIAAEDIGKFPDQNVAESLQRISGVAISRENGEGSKLTIRGFGPKFNVVQLNERTLATTDASRSLDFQLLPSELISGAEVSKTPMAKTPEGSMGAYVNIKTARPLNKPGFQAAGSIKSKYNDLSDEYSPKFSGIISNTFLDDRFGVLLGFSHEESTNRIDLVETKRWDQVKVSDIDGAHDERGEVVPETKIVDGEEVNNKLWFPGRYQFTLAEEERERTGANATLEFAQSDDITHRIDFLYSDFSRQENKQGMQVPMQVKGWQNVIASDAGTAIAGEKNHGKPLDGQFGIRGTDSETQAIGYNLLAYMDDFTFNFDVSYSTADANIGQEDLVPHYSDGTNSTPDNPDVFDMRDNDIITYTTPIDYTDPANARAHFNNLVHQELEDEITEVQFDVSYNIDSGVLVSIDTGVSYFDREKIVDDYRIPQGTACRDKPDPSDKTTWGPAICGKEFDLPDEIFAVNTTSDYLSEESGTFPRQFMIVADLDAYHAAMAELRGQPDWPRQDYDETRSTSVEETRTSIYAQANLAGEVGGLSWSGNVGLRYVDTETTSRGHGKNRLSIEVEVDEEGKELLNVMYSEPGQIKRENSYDNVLPSANFKLDINDNLVARLSGAQVISLPAITDIGTDRKYTDSRVDNFAQSGGNPFLNPYEATQFDFTLEYYQDNGSAYAVNFFTKDIDTFISKKTTSDPTPDIYVNGGLEDSTVTLADGSNLSELITQKENRNGGKINGVELAALHYFDYLPGFLSGFGIQANATFLDSEDDNSETIELDGIKAPSSGLEGFSETSYNIIAFYEKDAFQGRIAYNWRDDFLKLRNGTRYQHGEGIPEHVKAYGQLDASVSYKISEHFQVSLAAINLTDEKTHEYLDIEERLGRIQYTGTRYTLGLRAKF